MSFPCRVEPLDRWRYSALLTHSIRSGIDRARVRSRGDARTDKRTHREELHGATHAHTHSTQPALKVRFGRRRRALDARRVAKRSAVGFCRAQRKQQQQQHKHQLLQDRLDSENRRTHEARELAGTVSVVVRVRVRVQPVRTNRAN